MDGEDFSGYLEYLSHTVFQHEPLEGLAEFQKLFTRLGKKALDSRPATAGTWPPHAPGGGAHAASQDHESLPAAEAQQLGASSRTQMRGTVGPGAVLHVSEDAAGDPGRATSSRADAEVRSGQSCCPAFLSFPRLRLLFDRSLRACFPPWGEKGGDVDVCGAWEERENELARACVDALSGQALKLFGIVCHCQCQCSHVEVTIICISCLLKR